MFAASVVSSFCIERYVVKKFMDSLLVARAHIECSAESLGGTAHINGSPVSITRLAAGLTLRRAAIYHRFFLRQSRF